MTRNVTRTQWLINGVESSSLSLDDRGLAYGDGLFETMRAIGQAVPLLDLHLSRLVKGCQSLGIELSKQDVGLHLNQALSKLGGDQQHVIKIVVSRGGQALGYVSDNDAKPNVYIRITLLNPPLKNALNEPAMLNAQLCSIRLASQPALAGIKHLNRLEQVLAAAELNSGVDEGILLDSDNHVIEAISSNLIAVIDDDLYFPIISTSGVHGVMQQHILQWVDMTLGIKARSLNLPLSQFLQASEILVSNAVRGVRNIHSIDNEWQSQEQRMGAKLRAMLQQTLHHGFFSF